MKVPEGGSTAARLGNAHLTGFGSSRFAGAEGPARGNWMERVETLLARLTLEEKVSMVAGSDAWHSTGVERLGIPAFKLTDGPNAARGDGRSGTRAACFPVGVALAASWNVELLETVGAALGDEAKSKGAQVLLGPTINIQRTPIGGRNFECYSEDPLLSGVLATAFVRGVQSQGVAACPKHFVCNDTEHQRHSVSANVDERTLREIYLKPFEMTVQQGDAWCVMSAYNRINGVFASSHHQLLNEVLKSQWRFGGVVVSDWGAALHTVENANAGLDLEMPGPARTMGDKLLAAVSDGRVAETVIDDKVRRLLRLLVKTGKLDSPAEVAERSDDTPEKRRLARRAAIEGSVLLKNDPPVSGERPLLPLDPRRLERLAVVGPNAEFGRIQGGGSSSAPPHHVVHPLAAIAARVPDCVLIHEVGCLTHKYLPAFDPRQLEPVDGVDIDQTGADHTSRGFAIDYFAAPDFSGTPFRRGIEPRSKLVWFGAAATDRSDREFAARLSAHFTPDVDGLHQLGLMSAGRSRLLLDGELLIDNWTRQTRGESFFAAGSTEVRADVRLEAGKRYSLVVEFQRSDDQLIAGLQVGVLPPGPEDPIGDAARAAKAADAVILIVGTHADWESEGHDRADLALPGNQSELIERVCDANPRTVVVLNAGSPVDTGWLDRVPAALQVWFPGQEFGDALCDVLFGDANPSGKLPLSIPCRLEDTPAFDHYPGSDQELPYAEGVFVGYRWYDTRGIAPRLPFGHGLSYTTFRYGDLLVEPVQVVGDVVRAALDVTNDGDRLGAEVVQLYVRDLDASVPRPRQELVGFAKIRLEPGESRRVEFELSERSFAFWDVGRHDWRVEPGGFELMAGSSSRDIRSCQRIELSGGRGNPG